MSSRSTALIWPWQQLTVRTAGVAMTTTATAAAEIYRVQRVRSWDRWFNVDTFRHELANAETARHRYYGCPTYCSRFLNRLEQFLFAQRQIIIDFLDREKLPWNYVDGWMKPWWDSNNGRAAMQKVFFRNILYSNEEFFTLSSSRRFLY